MSELRKTARPKRSPPASLTAGAPSSPDLPAQAGKSAALASAGAGQTPDRPTRGKAPEARGGGPSRKRRLAAASDDASGTSGAATAHTPAAPPARDAYAAAAEARTDGATPRVPGDAQLIPGGEGPLPQDGAAFAEALHARVDLLKVSERLLRSEDEKVAQRELDLRLNFRYPKGSAAEENVEIILDVPRPNRPDA